MPHEVVDEAPGQRSATPEPIATLPSPTNARLRDGEPSDITGWDDTNTIDTARDKATASHETMGLVSALLAGFELAALVEVDMCNDSFAEDCTGAESGFVVCASYCVGLSTIVVLETSFEYMFVMRELHHGNASAWELINAFRFCRRIAETFFALEIIMFLASVGLLVHVRFARLLPAATAAAQGLLVLNFGCIFLIVAMMQRAKIQHGEGKKQKRAEADERRRKRRQEAELRRMQLGVSGKRQSVFSLGSGKLPLSLKRMTMFGSAPAGTSPPSSLASGLAGSASGRWSARINESGAAEGRPADGESGDQRLLAGAGHVHSSAAAANAPLAETTPPPMAKAGVSFDVQMAADDD